MVRKKIRNQASIKRRRSLRNAYFLALFALLVSSLFIYSQSFESRTHYLKCEGNLYYSNQEIYKMAGVNTDTRLWMLPSIVIQYRMQKNPMIQKVEVEKKGNSLTLHVKEKLIIGYYTSKEGKLYYLTSEKESIEINDKELKRIVHYPMLHSFTSKNRQRLAAAFHEQTDSLTPDVIEKIAQMSPYENSFDKYMVQIQMSDGNTLYSSLNSLNMLKKYKQVLPKLNEVNACMYLDGAHNEIVKSACTSFNKTASFLEDVQLQDEVQQNVDTPESYEFADTGIFDSEYYEIYNLYYSPSADIYMYAPTRTYYYLDVNTYSFVQMN
ncbi:MAG: FtsQ-type POTRA domain-containing protein [Firmicutes bacterium]|nr:FtsQ-type POTRA domain-containing protein [Bacillota bacterium]